MKLHASNTESFDEKEFGCLIDALPKALRVKEPGFRTVKFSKFLTFS